MEKITEFKKIPKFTREGSYEVDYAPESLVEFFAELVENDGLQLDPDFQRAHVWSTEQQIAFIEFILRGGKTARVLYLNKPSWSVAATTDYDEFVLVDGKQRFEAWRRFYANEIPVFGSYLREYTDSLRWSLNTMWVNINTLQTRAEVLQWYLEFNSGGTPHTKEELDRVRKLLEEEKSKPKKKRKVKK